MNGEQARPSGEFGWVVDSEIVCESEEAAKQEAHRRQTAEPPDSNNEWIYLRNKAGQWVARSGHLSVDAGQTKSFWANVADFVGELLS